jgi:cytochrome c553
MKNRLCFTSVLVSVVYVFMSSSVFAEEFFSFKNGELERPVGYREWIYVGAPVTPDDMNNGKANFPEFHSVYIDPKSWDYWKKTGKFRDGTILIKEMNKVGSKSAPSGQGYFMGRFMGLEATIKSKSNFPNEPGNWAYFSFSTADHKSLKKTTKAEPAANCNTCHEASAKDDFVFTQYYPVLEAAKADPKKAVGGEW